MSALNAEGGRDADKEHIAQAQPHAVFSEPLQVGSYTLITVRELVSKRGRIVGRPVAVIVAGPDGVRIDPIIDITKLGMAGIAFVGGLVWGIVLSRRPLWPNLGWK